MFKKNLEYINNDDLKTRLEGYAIDETKANMSYCMTTSNDYLLMKNDIPLDDLDNPRQAVQKMMADTIKKPMEKNDIIITFGIGLCYQLDEVFNAYPSRIFVYEPDTKLLHFVLNNVDISDHLKSGRVFIFDDLDALIAKLSEIYLTKDKIEVLYLKNYAVIKSQELLELTQKVYEACKSKTVDVNTITRYSKTWLENTLRNIGIINNSTAYKLSDLEGKFTGQAALVAAAGPSLTENIGFIRNNREKFVIFAVNKAIKTLLDNDITPDFAVCMDAKFVGRTLEGLDEKLQNVNCIMNINSDSDILTKKFKKVFVSFPMNDMVINKLSQFNDFIKPQESGGSATTMAFVTAVKMGFSKVVMTGVDLAFKGEQVYANGESYEKVSSDEMKINSITKNFVTVPSVTGTDVVTSSDYAAFIHHFEVLIKDLNYVSAYNTSSFGANIPGMKNMSIDKIPLFGISNTTAITLGEVLPFKLATQAWTQGELVLINEVIALLSKGEFSPALVSTIAKSPLMYQYMQAEILEALQSKMADSLAESFIAKAKEGIKYIVEALQQNNLI